MVKTTQRAADHLIRSVPGGMALLDTAAGHFVCTISYGVIVRSLSFDQLLRHTRKRLLEIAFRTYDPDWLRHKRDQWNSMSVNGPFDTGAGTPLTRLIAKAAEIVTNRLYGQINKRTAGGFFQMQLNQGRFVAWQFHSGPRLRDVIPLCCRVSDQQRAELSRRKLLELGAGYVSQRLQEHAECLPAMASALHRTTAVMKNVRPEFYDLLGATFFGELNEGLPTYNANIAQAFLSSAGNLRRALMPLTSPLRRRISL